MIDGAESFPKNAANGTPMRRLPDYGSPPLITKSESDQIQSSSACSGNDDALIFDCGGPVGLKQAQVASDSAAAKTRAHGLVAGKIAGSHQKNCSLWM